MFKKTKSEVVKSQYEITIDGDEKNINQHDESETYWFNIAGHEYIPDGKYGYCVFRGEIKYLYDTGEEIDCKYFGFFESLKIDKSDWL